MKKFPWQKKVIIALWILFLAVCIGMLLIFPNFFKPQAIADFIFQFKNLLLTVYSVICILRGLTLIPNTPFLLAGMILFPGEPVLVLTISILGIIFSSTMLYYFSGYLGFGNYLEERYPNRLVKIKDQLQKPTGFIFVMIWAFFPVVPTDAVCYVAGVLKMNFTKFILAIGFGELIICAIYVFFYNQLVNLVQSSFG
jgi:uncharacterized membrane protein YdjX (TVP38/TMEM64 family)